MLNLTIQDFEAYTELFQVFKAWYIEQQVNNLYLLSWNNFYILEFSYQLCIIMDFMQEITYAKETELGLEMAKAREELNIKIEQGFKSFNQQLKHGNDI